MNMKNKERKKKHISSALHLSELKFEGKFTANIQSGTQKVGSYTCNTFYFPIKKNNNLI